MILSGVELYALHPPLPQQALRAMLCHCFSLSDEELDHHDATPLTPRHMLDNNYTGTDLALSPALLSPFRQWPGQAAGGCVLQNVG